MDWQLVGVGGCVLVASLVVLRAIWRTWRPGANGCAGGCGCARAAKPPALQSVGLIRRSPKPAPPRQS